MTTTLQRRRRGSTMIELLTAGAVLIIGLTGVVAMLMRSAAVARSGVSSANSVTMANSALQEITAIGYDNLTVGTFDAGTTKDEAGRDFIRTYTVAAIDAGAPTLRAYVVTVAVGWRDSQNTAVRQWSTTSTIITQKPGDGG